MNAERSARPEKPLEGWRVLVPRGGSWGEGIAASLRAEGAVPVVAPLINFAPVSDAALLAQSIADLEAGMFDWLTITSATTVDVLDAHEVKLPPNTKVAAVGETTAAALQADGFRVDLIAREDNSAEVMAQQLVELETEPRNILTLRSSVAKPVLAQILADAGHHVRSVVAYRTVGEPVTERVARDVASGRINAILVTSGLVAEQVREQFPNIPDGTVIAAIGARSSTDADSFGLTVDAVESSEAVDALIVAVSRLVLPHAADETRA